MLHHGLEHGVPVHHTRGSHEGVCLRQRQFKIDFYPSEQDVVLDARINFTKEKFNNNDFVMKDLYLKNNSALVRPRKCEKFPSALCNR